MTACRFVAKDQPRALKGRHTDTCPETVWHAPLASADCTGCEPCGRHHCSTCGNRHVDGLTCPECVGEARDNLTKISINTAQLLGEAVHRGVNSEAAHLEGPAAQAEAWRQRRRHGFTPHPDDLVGDTHPLWILGTWDLLVTEHYGHHRTTRVTIATAIAYLGANLTDLAQDDDFAFEDLARDLRTCNSHLEAVLHDSAQGDRANVGCFDCGGDLERNLTEKQGFQDWWTCRGCRRSYTQAEYNFALRAKLEQASA